MDKLTVKDIVEEFGISEPIVRKMFKDPEFPAQIYTKPMFITRDNLMKYLSKRHDNLSNKPKDSTTNDKA